MQLVCVVFSTHSPQVEEFGRDVYKLFKQFNAKAKQLRKERGGDLGQGVRRDTATAKEEEEEEFAPLRIAKTTQEQIRQFKVRRTVMNGHPDVSSTALG